MFSTYQRLNLSVMASNFAVIKAARRKIATSAKHDIRWRNERKQFYRQMLKHHASERKLFNYVIFGEN